MFKFHKKTLIKYAAISLALLFIAFSALSIRNSFLGGLKLPFNFFTILQREMGAVIFYHRNFSQNGLLRKDNDFLKSKLIKLEEFSQENSRLKDLLSFKQDSSLRVIVAKVISRSAENWSSIIIINKGRRQGVKQGMVVITRLGLAGRVAETQEQLSKVLLITDPSLSVSAMSQRSRQEGLVCGTLGANLIMRYLPRDCDIKINDTIITSGLSEIYPKGILIGAVTEVGNEFSGLSRYAVIKPAVNLFSIEEALVVVP